MNQKSLFRYFTFFMTLLFLGWTAHAQQRLQTARNSDDTILTSAIKQEAESSESPESSPSDDHYASPFDAVKGKKEDLSKRDAFSKHYFNKDGSYTALIGAGPIHYEKNGQFLDIDHTITRGSDSEFPYVNTTNLFESYFGANVHQGVKNKTPEGEVVEFLNTQLYWEVNGEPAQAVSGADVAISVAGDKAYYNNLYGNISAEFVMLTGKRELNYIIPNRQALGNFPQNADYLVFTEDVILPQGWTSTITEHGILIKNAGGKEMYLYENPNSTDASEKNLSREKNTFFEIDENENVLTIKTKVKTEWLLSNDRQYPVKVDPTVEAEANGSRSVYSDGIQADLGYFGANQGYYIQYHIKFDVSSIPIEVEVNSTRGYFWLYGTGGTLHPNNRWHWSKSADPTTTSGVNLYNSANDGLSDGVSINNQEGWKNDIFYDLSNIKEYVEDGISSGFINATIRPFGNYYQTNFFGARTHNDTDKPYLEINYTKLSSDRTLTVSGAGDNADPENGARVYDHEASVTAYAGEQEGYVSTGWTGTGSVPATGNTDSITFTIAENSSIEWQWEQTGTPKEVVFYNQGGEDQLAFNNSRTASSDPVFRMSHENYEANAYEIEVNEDPQFSGTSYTQEFQDTFPVDTEANFTFTNLTPADNTTYYVRARVKGDAEVWSDWTTETYSFTYSSEYEIPDWFQTEQAQFKTDALNGVLTNSGHFVETGAGGNRVLNGSFENNLSNWSTDSNFIAAYKALRDGAWKTDGNYSLLLYNNSPGTYGYSTGDYVSAYQIIDLTNISNIQMDANYESSSQAVEFRIYIAETSDPTGLEGILVHTWRPPTGNNPTSINVDLSSYNFTGDKILKLVYYVYDGYFTTNYRYLNIDNVVAENLPAGTITSTPIHLASVQDAVGYKGITWEQILNGGELTLTVEGSEDGENFSAIQGYENIRQTGDGIHNVDLSEMENPPAYLRLVGNLDGEGVQLHHWSVSFDAVQPEPEYDFVYLNNTDQWEPNYPGDSNNPSGATNTILIKEGTAIFYTDIVAETLTVNPEARLDVENILKLHGDLVNEGHITFKSSSIENTAQFDAFYGEVIGEGVVTTERYIPARRAFRFLSSAVTTHGTIQDNWQEGGIDGTDPNYEGGWGTHITGNGGAANGFDPTDTNNPSMFFIETDGNDQNWVHVENTNASILEAGTAYRLMVRGDRTIDMSDPTNNPPPTPTVLRATGALATGEVTISGDNFQEGDYLFIGNPYQAIVDIRLLLNASYGINERYYYLWNANLAGENGRGAYVTVDMDFGAGTSNPSSEANRYLQPGQAILVKATGEAPSVTFLEEYKVVEEDFTSTFRDPTSRLALQLFYQNAFDNGETPTDGISIKFSEQGNNGIDDFDAPKMGNLDENLATSNANEYFSIESRAYPEDDEIIPLFINNYRETDYVFQAEFLNIPDHTIAYLVDHYTGTSTEISGEDPVFYSFEIDPEIEESISSSRFDIQFTIDPFLEVNDIQIADIQLYPNPMTENSFHISAFGFKGEKLEIQMVTMLGQLIHTETVTVSADGHATVRLQNLASGVYNVKIISEANQTVSKKLIRN